LEGFGGWKDFKLDKKDFEAGRIFTRSLVVVGRIFRFGMVLKRINWRLERCKSWKGFNTNVQSRG